GVTLLSPLVLRGLQRVYQRPGELALGISGRLAADNFSRAPVRTAVPVSALGIGVAMTVCIGGFVGSFQTATSRWINQSVPPGLFAASPAKIAGVKNQPMKEELGAELDRIDGVASVDRLRIYPQDVLGLRVYILSLNPDIYNKRGKVDIIEGALPTAEQRAHNYVTISENLARRRDLRPESTIDIDTPTGRRAYKVAAVMRDYTSDQGAVFMDRRYFTE